MIEAHTVLKERLQTEGYSLTKPRRAVFDALRGREAQSMRELINRLAGTIDRASVYRTVTLFEQLGIVQRLQIGWKYKIELSHTFSDHHHHLICLQCGKVFTFEESLELEEEIERTARRHHFTVSEHQLEIRGLCETCEINQALAKLPN